MRAGETRYVHFPILPVILGKVKVVVDAHCILYSQRVAKTVTIEVYALDDNDRAEKILLKTII